MFEQANCPHFKTNYSNSPPCQNMNLVLTDSLFCSQSCSIQYVVFKWGIHSPKINQCVLSMQMNNSDLNDFNKQYNTLRRQDDRIFVFPDGADDKGATGREDNGLFSVLRFITKNLLNSYKYLKLQIKSHFFSETLLWFFYASLTFLFLFFKFLLHSSCIQSRRLLWRSSGYMILVLPISRLKWLLLKKNLPRIPSFCLFLFYIHWVNHLTQSPRYIVDRSFIEHSIKYDPVFHTSDQISFMISSIQVTTISLQLLQWCPCSTPAPPQSIHSSQNYLFGAYI